MESSVGCKFTSGVPSRLVLLTEMVHVVVVVEVQVLTEPLVVAVVPRGTVRVPLMLKSIEDVEGTFAPA